ncbi:MAG: LPS export ABC transporter permease LptF [Deltaproteobacteria bacterium]|nr:LPS export ABC transporter permease LptF [Deltaproteobacteria bacterium]
MLIIKRYVCREILVPFFFSLAVMIFILLLGNLFKIAEMVVAAGVRLSDVFLLVLNMVPYSLTMAIPTSFFLGLMVGLGRLGSDGEVTAMKSLGFSPLGLLPPVLTIAVLCTAACLVLELWLSPHGMRRTEEIALNILKEKTVLALRPRAISMEIPRMVVYVDNIDRDGGRMGGIVIFDQRRQQTEYVVTAAAGRVLPDRQTGNLVFLLRDGTIHSLDRQRQGYQLTDFREYKINLDLETLLGRRGRSRHSRALTLGELYEKIAARRQAGRKVSDVYNRIYKRFAMPFSCLVFALLGIPLALEPVRVSGRFRGFVYALVLMLGYYLLMSLGQALGENGGPLQLPLNWLANFVYGGLGVYLLYQKQREREVAWLRLVNNFYRRAARAWQARK